MKPETKRRREEAKRAEAQQQAEAQLLTQERQREWNRSVLRMAHHCPYPEWMLLELPNGMFGALWSQGFDSWMCQEIAEGRYRNVCAYRSRSKDRVLAYMHKHRLE